jgi:protein-tyrosine phosphatase
LVERGVLASINAASMEGRFGRTVRAAALEMLDAGLIHNVASDAHNTDRRAPGLRQGFAALDLDLAGLQAAAGWFTLDVPRALLMGDELPRRPAIAPRRRRARWRRASR